MKFQKTFISDRPWDVNHSTVDTSEIFLHMQVEMDKCSQINQEGTSSVSFEQACCKNAPKKKKINKKEKKVRGIFQKLR